MIQSEVYKIIEAAQALVDITREYLLEIQMNQEWSLKSQEYTSKQAQLADKLQEIDWSSLTLENKKLLKDHFRSCYQMELQINNEISRQHKMMALEISRIRKNDQLKRKYDFSPNQSGIMLDTFN